LWVLSQLRVLGYHSLNAVLQRTAHLCPYGAERSFLCIIQQGELFLVAHVSAGGGNAGQIVGECRFSLVMCRFDFCPANQKFFVVGNSQCTATIQTQNILCGQGQHQTGQVDETEELFHCIYTLKHLWKLYLIKQQ